MSDYFYSLDMILERSLGETCCSGYSVIEIILMKAFLSLEENR